MGNERSRLSIIDPLSRGDFGGNGALSTADDDEARKHLAERDEIAKSQELRDGQGDLPHNPGDCVSGDDVLFWVAYSSVNAV